VALRLFEIKSKSLTFSDLKTLLLEYKRRLWNFKRIGKI
jgi:hypothetical protein